MTVNLDPAGDFDLFDGQTTVAYVSTSGESSDTTVSSVPAVYRAATHREATQAAALGLSTIDRVFHVQASSVTSITPKEGDKLTDAAGVSWRVVMVALQTLGTRWRLSCHRQGP